MTYSAERNILTVSQLNRKAKQLLETHLPLIWVSGEISNLAKPSSGHWYFSLKDSHAQVRCAMFRTTNQRVRFAVDSGQQVLIRARVSLYEGRGEYQLIAEHIEPAGAGALQLEYERLKAALSAEGLFDTENKKSLPPFPQDIAVITSPTGAAIHDILSVLKRRYPIASVVIIPVSVQGDTAAPEMIEALRKAEQLAHCDVVIIGRGGGSIEDLWAFNNETLVRAIARFSIPIVSAVGHEVDVTLTDFVADQRAPTPSASAEIVSPDMNEWQLTLDIYQSTLMNRFLTFLQEKRQRLTLLSQRLRHPKAKIDNQRQQISYAQQQLHRAIQQQLTAFEHRLNTLSLRLKQQNPQYRLDHHKDTLKNLSLRLYEAQRRCLEQCHQQLEKQVTTLHAISPLAVLSRGYSITMTNEGQVLSASKSAALGQKITTTLATGVITSTITAID